MKKDDLPGLAVITLVAAVSILIATYLGIPLMSALGMTRNPVEATVFAIVIGVLARNLGLIPASWEAGVKASDKFLIWGIILYGASLDFLSFAEQGPRIFAAIIVTMLVGFFGIYLMGLAFKLPPKLSILLGVGTTICGSSAIAISSPLIDAKKEDTSYAVTTISLWGLLAIVTYPYIAMAIPGVNDQAFGVFAGTAIHATPQVVGAGFIYSDAAGNVATAVKLVRNCFMVPLALGLAVWYARKRAKENAQGDHHVNWTRGFPWFLFGFFVMAVLGTRGFFTDVGLASFKSWGNFFILMGMVGIGMQTRLSSFRGIGVKPFVVGLIGAALVAAVSAGMIWFLALHVMPAAG